MAVRTAIFYALCGLIFFAGPTAGQPSAEGSRAQAGQDRKAPSEKKPKTKVEYKKHFETKPLEKSESVRWSHAPFHQADCGLCHVSDDPKKPGKLRATTNKICFSCHERTKTELETHKMVHKPSENCDHCHNAHNSKYRFLLHEPPKRLCTTCHVGIGTIIKSSKVKHDPTTKGNTCRSCHSSHASSVDHLLRALPSDMCLDCHGKDDVKNNKGEKLINLARRLKDFPVHHKPVDNKDCSACHGAHGTQHYRLLIADYPHEFYASYSKETYALCLSCHNKEEAITEAETEDATAFRDGKKNLHAVHVVKPERGRTCRTCHGEHATKQKHLMRQEIPYGKQGWKLQINYQPTDNGGRCTKTCHDTKEYKNK